LPFFIIDGDFMALENVILDKTMKKYGVPEWVKPYVYSYIKNDPVNAVRKGISFVDVKRKRGKISGETVELPNAIKFDLADVAHIVGLFYFGEQKVEEVIGMWSKDRHDYESKAYAEHFESMVGIEDKHLHAIKNMLNGLGKKGVEESPEIDALFEKMRSIEDWRERIIAYDLILKTSYGGTFGNIFYKVFYSVMPEYMRSFGKAFSANGAEVEWGYEEAKRIMREKEIPDERLLGLFREILPLIAVIINSNIEIARRVGIEKEVNLLMDIAIAYPMHIAEECGIDIDADKEASKIISGIKKREKLAKE